MIRKGIALHGSWHYNLGDIPLLMQTVADCATQINRLISHRFALNDVQAAWELQATGECGKVILQPWG
jgi:threonine dehydrogenase-like Zn-dependent dehydrogenase